MRRRGRRLASERGSALALVPAAFLVLIVLGALAVDSAIAYQAQQQLHDTLAAAANDAVAAGLDDSAFYRRGDVALQPAAVAEVVCQAVAAADMGRFAHLRVDVAVGSAAVEVTGAATVAAVFGRALPGWGERPVRASASARLAQGPADPVRGPPGPVASPSAAFDLRC